MERRGFIKTLTSAGLTTLLPAGSLSMAISACASKNQTAEFDFDTVFDRSGTWSIKYGRATNGEIPMWIADMDFATDPYVKAALSARIDKDVLGYTTTPPEFIDAIAHWMEHYHSYQVDREWISYAPGVITAMNQAYLAFTNPGDKIIVQPPVYDHFKLYIERLGRIAVDNSMILENGQYRMDFEGLERLIDHKTKMLVLCNPNNPCGIHWDRETLAQLADICERHGIIVISDEIHSDLTLYGVRHLPFCSVSESAAKVGMIFSGPTKSFNLAGLTGTAFCIIPDQAKRNQYVSWLKNCKLEEPSIPTLLAVIASYRDDTRWLEALKRYIEDNVERVVDFFSTNKLGMTAHRPSTSFLVWIDCRSLGMPQDQLMARFKDGAKIILSNGASYGPGGEGFVRMNVGCPRSTLNQALERIAREFGGNNS
ncbi:MAG: pyridoxal phosphate-dependent aminotransferase [Bacteroidaceae bacterium]|nr:pyridoxal phosphate-dependent aminotransferase [Bacteroidaceae bacterium]